MKEVINNKHYHFKFNLTQNFCEEVVENGVKSFEFNPFNDKWILTCEVVVTNIPNFNPGNRASILGCHRIKTKSFYLTEATKEFLAAKHEAILTLAPTLKFKALNKNTKYTKTITID